MFQIPFRDLQIKRVPLISTPRGQVLEQSFWWILRPVSVPAPLYSNSRAMLALSRGQMPSLTAMFSALASCTRQPITRRCLGRLRMRGEEEQNVLSPHFVLSQSRWWLLVLAKAREHRRAGRERGGNLSPFQWRRGSHQRRHLSALCRHGRSRRWHRQSSILTAVGDDCTSVPCLRLGCLPEMGGEHCGH